MTTSTFDKIYANAQNMNIETSEWFNRAGFFWCQCTEKQLQKMRLLLRAQGCKTIMRDDGEPRNVIFFDGGGRIALEELPVNPEWCREDVEAWFTENRYIHGVNSQYDCTGCLFTEWFKVFRRRGRWYAYHCIGMDI